MWRAWPDVSSERPRLSEASVSDSPSLCMLLKLPYGLLTLPHGLHLSKGDELPLQQCIAVISSSIWRVSRVMPIQQCLQRSTEVSCTGNTCLRGEVAAANASANDEPDESDSSGTSLVLHPEALFRM